MTDAEYQAKYGWFDEDAHNGIKSKARVRKFAEVLTPRWLAENTNKGRVRAAFIRIFQFRIPYRELR